MKRDITPYERNTLLTMLGVGTQLVSCLDVLEECIKDHLGINPLDRSDDEACDHVTDAIHMGLPVQELLERLQIRVTLPEHVRDVH
jgi:hypothetical protein